MPELAKSKASYEDLYGIPENMIGEILGGELVVTQRPSRQHAVTASRLGSEILSPGSLRVDRIKKMPLYAQNEVQYAWLIDPSQMMLEVFRLESGKWLLLGVFAENDKVRAEPSHEVETDLGLFGCSEFSLSSNIRQA